MIVYIPTPITSAEQAESLPIGTVSIADHPDDKPAIKITEQSWVCVWDVDDDHDATYDVASNGHMIGSTVLVPIEAREETRVTPEALVTAVAQVPPRAEEAARIYAIPPGGLTIQQQARLVTPWEEA